MNPAGPDLVSAFAGTLCVSPGAPLPTIRSTRRAWATRIARGRAAAALPALLGSVYALCGGAHRVAAQRAVAAARGVAVHDDGAEAAAQRQLLRHDTLREHLRRLWLDAPGGCPGLAAPDPQVLAGCPALHDAAAVDGARGWVEAQVFGAPVDEWLAGWRDDPRAHAAHWAAGAATWPARWLGVVRHAMPRRPLRVQPLLVHASDGELLRLAARLRDEADFAQAPTWRGRTAETGTWTRLADDLGGERAPLFDEPWMRHAARVADVARLASRGGERWLSSGHLATGDGEGLGWCETARGLLLHWVRLDADDRVADCRVVAPTEWNFHPYGPAARALAALPPGLDEARVRLLVAAYDPCVAVTLERVAAKDIVHA